MTAARLIVPDDEIDPQRDRVFRVEVTISGHYDTYVVAETSEGAEDVARETAYEDARDADLDYDYWAHQVEELEGRHAEDGKDVPCGRSFYKGRQLTLAEVVRLIRLGAPPPVYDTQTALMPFVDSPPPLRMTLEEWEPDDHV